MPKRPESPVATEAPVQATMSSNPDCPCAPNMILAIHPKTALAIHPKTALSTRRALEDSKLTIPVLLEYPKDDLECTGWEHFILTPERPPMASAQQQWHGWSFVTPYPQRLEQDSPMLGREFEDL
ncbi:hypothetical protein F751_4048 [Auxenochlorella protothecoides]|uniref:Uncharacterized protein n=1 Tax=Auxenochlorella protothecoides TaxID=3075 RepID=A0A087SE69_AUXPR|nr:hypothetical protein F751_4048 [Auxenochlorella protothecoides]KFM24023.1 hypothetical protein F751_4048 [Auxenochlorella protothecoides]